jgi:uncharacterized Ntn-hydrolase superfamily protein
MTISIAGRCGTTGMLGVAIASSSPCVAARCAFAQAGAGAVLSQNVTDPRLGPRGLELMRAGLMAKLALNRLLAEAGALAAYRQLVLVDAQGRTAIHTGARALGNSASARGDNCAAAGNLLANLGVPRAMADAFQGSTGKHLAERLLRALEAGIEAGGEAGPVKSAGLLVAHLQAWPLADLRVDWADKPVAALRQVWDVYRPQMDAYVTRALDPASAPAFGVPGDP